MLAGGEFRRLRVLAVAALLASLGGARAEGTGVFVLDRNGAKEREVLAAPLSREPALRKSDPGLNLVPTPRLRFQGGAIDRAPVPDRHAGRHLQLVQFKVPPTAAERAALEADGNTVVCAVPEYGFLVWTESEAQRASLRERACHPTARLQMGFDPALVLSAELRARRREKGKVLVQVQALMFQETPTLMDDVEWLFSQPDIHVRSNGLTFGMFGPCALVVLEVPPEMLDRVAELPTMVSMVEAGALRSAGESSDLIVSGITEIVDGKLVPKNKAAGGDYLGFLAERFAGTSDYRNPANYPLVSVVDTGIDNGGSDTTYTADNPVSPDFRQEGSPNNPGRIQFSYRWDTRNGAGTPPQNTGRMAYDLDGGVDSNGQLVESHGTGVASALAGYNADNNPADGLDRDPSTGHQYGLGTSPFGRIANVSFRGLPQLTFQPDLYDPNDLHLQIANTARLAKLTNPPGGHPGRIANNSWFIYRPWPDGSCVPGPAIPSSVYQYSSMIFDARTQDSLPDNYYPEHAGFDRTLFVVAAGNTGFHFLGEEDSCAPTACGFMVPRLNSIPEPGNAKNVLTVGASEDVDPRTGIAGCGANPLAPPCGNYVPAMDPGRADDARDIAPFSSKGSPTGFTFGGKKLFVNPRIKPDIVAPGAFVYNNPYGGTATCGTTKDDYVPGTTFPRVYKRSVGTSLATPQVSGGVQLFAYHLKERYGLADPSPALLKAYAIHTGRFLSGAQTGPYDPVTGKWDPHPLPSPYQGFGQIDLAMGLDTTPRHFVDETVVFTQPGAWGYRAKGSVAVRSKPVRVVLVWTDAVDYVNTDIWHNLVNDLDLTVTTIGGKGARTTYWGNLFNRRTKRYSQDTAGVSTAFRDRENNVEAVFLPENSCLSMEIAVDPFSITADARNMNAWPQGPPQQHWALAVYNFRLQSENVLRSE